MLFNTFLVSVSVADSPKGTGFFQIAMWLRNRLKQFQQLHISSLKANHTVVWCTYIGNTLFHLLDE
jgi:hypothetical protein